jgi:PPOX class probable FMN-dependent enzyme
MAEMLQAFKFTDTVTSEAELRAIIGLAKQRSLDKTIGELDEYCKEHIAHCPFLLIASCDAAGNMDVSPKGDPPGFVRVLNDRTLVIPDRPGNRRADTFTNVLQNPNVSVLFLVPGRRETLRIVGRAQIVRDQELRQSLAINGKVPELLLGVEISEAFFHCAKCIIRSNLWQESHDSGLATYGEMLAKHTGTSMAPSDLQNEIEDNYRTGLY